MSHIGKGFRERSYRLRSALGIISWDIDARSSFKITAIHDFDGGGTVAPQFSFTVADGLQAKCEIFFFYGESDTAYGGWKDNSLGKVSLKYSF